MTDMIYRPAQTGPVEPILSRWWRTVDHMSIAAVIALFSIGLLLSMASSPILAERKELAQFHFVYRQAFFGAVALVAMIIISTMTPRTVRRWAVFGCAVSLVAVMLLPLFGTDLQKGATRWFSLGFFNLQPSEFLKPGFIVVTAWLMAASFDRRGPPGFIMSFLFAAFIALLLALQPDFGQAALVVATWGVMYFVAGAPVWLFVGFAGLVLGAGVVAYKTSSHFASRIDGFLSTDIDPTTQLGHAASAFREGGLFGVGIGEGEIKRTLPDAYTDFIIAVAAEEYGVILCFAVIALILTIVVRALWTLQKERDRFTCLAGVGLSVMFAFQALINLGVAVRLLPAKGMTLPFVSYGGSSLIASGIGLGMLFAFSRMRPQEGLDDVYGSPQ
jgi:cell division protein FtsW